MDQYGLHQHDPYTAKHEFTVYGGFDMRVEG